MPLKTFKIDQIDYQIITANKAHEPEYRHRLTRILKKKYGDKIDRQLIIEALKVAFDFYAEEIEKEIRQIKDAFFFIYVYFLHEQTAELSYKTQQKYELQIDQSYFALYRRILKLILQESCFLDLETNTKLPDTNWISENVFIIEKIIYLGDFLFMQAEAIAEEEITGGSIDIVYKNGIVTFVNTKEWKNFLSSLTYDFKKDVINSIIDTNLETDFNTRIKEYLKLDLRDITETIASLNNLLHNRNPPELCLLDEFLKIIKEESDSPFIETFVKGLILNRNNSTDIKSTIRNPYSGKRIMHKPILTLTIDGTECIMADQFSFAEALNTFFQNNITLGKIPVEWEQVDFLKKIRNDYKDHNKDILEDPVENKLKNNNLDYVRNIKKLLIKDKTSFVITPGEIDFIFLFNKKIYIADCKNLTKRYEMRGYYQDISKFTKEYNPKMKQKIEFLNSNILKLQEHLQLVLKKPNLDLSDYQLEGIFIINTPTIYMLNGKYKIFTFYRFSLFLGGDNFFDKYIVWPEDNPKHKICWPFIDNLKAIISQELSFTP